jgi:hypothetical protein
LKNAALFTLSEQTENKEEKRNMLTGTLLFMTGLFLGYAWGVMTGREYPNGPQGRT